MNNEFIMAEYEPLREKLESLIPFDVYPTKEMIALLRKQGKKFPISYNKPISITKVENMGEMGGLTCFAEFEGEVLGSSLTHLKVYKNSPIYNDVEEYTRKRIKWLKKNGGFV